MTDAQKHEVELSLAERRVECANETAAGWQDRCQQAEAERDQLRAQLQEQWPNLAHQNRDKLLAACQAVGVKPAGKWLSDIALEAIAKLNGRVAELEAAILLTTGKEEGK